MLGRKGYPPGVALAVVREALAGDAEGVEGEGADGDVSDGARGELSDDAHAC
jgi:hypothetical protein